jgi:hypothetical protein
LADANIEPYNGLNPNDPAHCNPNNKNAGWLDPLAKFYDHQALNYQAVLACAFASSFGTCINDNPAVPTDAETVVSLKPDPSTLCWFWPATIAAQAQAQAIAMAWSPPVAPPSWRLTAETFTAIAEDSDLLDLAAETPLDRLPPLLLSAAVAFFVAGDVQRPIHGDRGGAQVARRRTAGPRSENNRKVPDAHRQPHRSADRCGETAELDRGRRR